MSKVKTDLTGNKWVKDQKDKRIEYEQRKAATRLRRLLEDRPTKGDFVDFLFDFTEQACGIRQQAPRDRGAETIQRFEGGRDAGLALEEMCRRVHPDALVVGFQRALKRVAEREERFRRIEEKARGGQPDPEPEPEEIES